MSSASERAAAVDPARVSVSRSRGLTIQWRDGHRSEFALRYLRDRCPCATCSETRGGPDAAPSPFPMFQPELRLLDVEPVGNYGIRLRWSDGHDTGIYSWQYLRTICPCPECTASAKP
ncbi:MAG: gamma-butyrobetaine hydroxylase-like domain-containing protein [Bryobacteraceae bacterium]